MVKQNGNGPNKKVAKATPLSTSTTTRKGMRARDHDKRAKAGSGGDVMVGVRREKGLAGPDVSAKLLSRPHSTQAPTWDDSLVQ